MISVLKTNSFCDYDIYYFVQLKFINSDCIYG